MSRLNTVAPCVVAALVAALPSGSAEAAEGASRLLSGTPETFQNACRAEIDAAKADIARLKGLKPAPAPTSVQPLETYDSAIEHLANAAARASLARNVHPAEAVRTIA